MVLPELVQVRVPLGLGQVERLVPHVQALVHQDGVVQPVLLQVDALGGLELLVKDVQARPNL